MAAKILDGKSVGEKWLSSLASEVKKLPSAPYLALIRVGEDEASGIYLKRKQDACAKIGIKSEIFHFPASASQDEIIKKVEDLNAKPDCSSILVQVPFPKHIDPLLVQEKINPLKDADGFGPKNMGLLMMGKPSLVAATPAGIMHLLEHYKISFAGKHAVVVGRSNIVGKPVAQLLLMQDATVTIAHSKTKNLSEITRQADILIVATGKANLISGKMIKAGAIVVDVGMNRNVDGDTNAKKLVGDVNFEEASQVASHITPVPGGVGPMTIASLMANTIMSYKLQH